MRIAEICLQPYHPERARSRLISEAKQGRAWLVLGWENSWNLKNLEKQQLTLPSLDEFVEKPKLSCTVVEKAEIIQHFGK